MWLRIGLLFVMACAETGGVLGDKSFTSVAPRGPLAVGAKTGGSATSHRCTQIDKHTECETPEVQATVTITPPGILMLEGPGVPYTVTAVGEGTATINIVANDGYESKTWNHSVEVMAIDNVVADVRNIHAKLCTLPAAYPTGALAYVVAIKRHGETPLLGDLPPSFAATGATVSEPAGGGSLSLIMDATPGTGALTTTLDPAFNFAFRRFAIAEVSAIALADPLATTVTRKEARLPFDLVLASGELACRESYTYVATSMTPEVCVVGFGDPYGYGTTATDKAIGGVVAVMGLKPGTCSITLALADAPAVMTTKQLTIVAAQ